MYKKTLALILSILMILSVVVALPTFAEETCAHAYDTAGKCTACGEYEWISWSYNANPAFTKSNTSNTAITKDAPYFDANTGRVEAPTGGTVTVRTDLVEGSEYAKLYAPFSVSFDFTVNKVLLNNASNSVPFPLLNLVGNSAGATTVEILSLGATGEGAQTVEVMFQNMPDRGASSKGVKFSSIYTMKVGETYSFFVMIDPVALNAKVYVNGEYAGACSLDGTKVASELTEEYKFRFGQETVKSPYFFNYSLDNLDATLYSDMADAYADVPTNKLFSLRYDRWQAGYGDAKPTLAKEPIVGNVFGAFQNLLPSATAEGYGTLSSNTTMRREIAISSTYGDTKFDLVGKKYEILVDFAIATANAPTNKSSIVRVYHASTGVQWELVSYEGSQYMADNRLLVDVNGNPLTFVREVTANVPASTSELRVVVDEAQKTYSVFVDKTVAYYEDGDVRKAFANMPLPANYTDSKAGDYDFLRMFAGLGNAIVKEISVSLIPDSNIEFIGSQSRNSGAEVKEGTFDLRFVFGVDDLYMENAGFRVTAYANGSKVGEQNVPLTSVYKALVAGDSKLQAFECPEGEYLAAFKIVGIEETTANTNYTFEITPYANGEDQETCAVAYNGIGQIAEPRLPEAPTPDEPGTETPEIPETFTPTVRFVVTSDIHISTEDGKTAGHFKSLMEQINAYVAEESKNGGYGKLDAVVVAGDITGEGSDSASDNATHAGGTRAEYEIVKKIFDNNVPADTQLILSMGNHDYGNVAISGYNPEEIEALSASFRKDFEEVFNTKAAQMVSINGFYFVTVDVDAAEGKTGHEYSESSAAALDANLKEATAVVGSNMPIFVFQHVGNYGTVLGTSQDAGASNYSTALYDVQKQYANAIVFSGHTHVPINDECSIHQRDFTSINTGALAGITRAKANGANIAMDNIKYPQAAYIVEADEYGRVRVRMWSAMDEGFYGDTWMIDSYNKDEFKYTEDRFSDEDIFFAKDAAITVEAVTNTSVTVRFPHVPEDSLTARAYEIIVKDDQGKEVKKVYRSLAYYKDDFTQTAKVTIDGLTAGTDYTVSVRAANPLYNMNVTAEGTLFSAPLTREFTTTPAIAIIGFTIGAKGIESSVGSMLTPTGTPIIVHDETLSKNVLSFNENNTGNVIYFNYANNNDVMSAFKEAFTLETYIRVDALPSTQAGDTLIGNLHNGTGFGLTIEKSGRIYFTIHGEDGSKVQLYDASCAVGTYNHIAVTYDGSTVTMYVNGTAVGEPSAVSGLKLHTVSGIHKIYLGADINGSTGADEAHSNCTIAHFSILPEALIADEIAERAAKFPSRQ